MIWLSLVFYPPFLAFRIDKRNGGEAFCDGIVAGSREAGERRVESGRRGDDTPFYMTDDCLPLFHISSDEMRC